MKSDGHCIIKVKIDKLITIYENYLGDYERFIEYAEKNKRKKEGLDLEARIIKRILQKLEFFKEEDTNVLFLPANRYYNLCKIAVDFELFD